MKDLKSNFYANFVQLCKNKGVTPTRAGIEAGISKQTVSNWKSGCRPGDTHIAKLADYFGVPPEYFWAETPAEIKASPAPRAEVEDIIKIYDMLTPERQKQLRAAIADLLKDQLQE